MADRAPLQLAAFRKALTESPEAVARLPIATYWRYANGELPKAVRWLIQHPTLLRALADDAEAAARTTRKPAKEAA